MWTQRPTIPGRLGPTTTRIDGARYGRMYSAGARSDARKICPSGWKVPNNDDVNALEAEIGGGDGSAQVARVALR